MNAGSAKPAADAARPYRSALRAQAAADTRATVLATAMRMFLEHGYGKVTIGDIADEASVAVPTVYASAGGKSAILSTLIDEAIRDPIVDETLAAVRECRSPREVIAATAHGTRVDNERYHDIVQVMKSAAAIDESATEILVHSDGEYLRALRPIACRLHELQALKPGLSEQRATDILWFYFGGEAWHLLVSDRHWSWEDAEHWLADQAAAALIDRQ
jgi:AcrR family transcriptional regulator